MMDNASMVYDFAAAADYMDIPDLLDITCKAIANMVKGKDEIETRAILKVKNDFTASEEDQIRRQNDWADDV